MLQGFNIPSEGLWFWFEGMIDLFFYVDLALNFFTAYEVSSAVDVQLKHVAHAIALLQAAQYTGTLPLAPVVEPQ
jgi:hypothetical protein